MKARRRASRRECASRTFAIDCTGDIRVHEATHSSRICWDWDWDRYLLLYINLVSLILSLVYRF